MHLKLSKFSLICKDLNEDSAVVKEDLSNTRAELYSMKDSRNLLATQVENVNSVMVELEALRKENQELKNCIDKNENASLIEASKALEERDKMILELNQQLERATSLLEEKQN